jgi:NAD binding domain of 6-phosphogluconate dehydrogenase
LPPPQWQQRGRSPRLRPLLRSQSRAQIPRGGIRAHIVRPPRRGAGARAIAWARTCSTPDTGTGFGRVATTSPSTIAPPPRPRPGSGRSAAGPPRRPRRQAAPTFHSVVSATTMTRARSRSQRTAPPRAPRGERFIDNTTASPTSRALNRTAKAKGFNFLDAPVSGGLARTQNGALTVMVGGEQAPFDKPRPVIAH